MSARILRTKGDIDQLATFLKGRKLPLSITIQSGKHRSVEQNRLQRLWCNEVAEQLGDQTPEEVRGFCKLTMGVPILRAENDAFCRTYDAIIKPLPYEAKLACMMEPLDFQVTRLMKVNQKVRYLDHMHRFWSEKGLVLTEPKPEFARDVQRANAARVGAKAEDTAA